MRKVVGSKTLLQGSIPGRWEWNYREESPDNEATAEGVGVGGRSDRIGLLVKQSPERPPEKLFRAPGINPQDECKRSSRI